MQNVVHSPKCDSPGDNELNEVGKEHSGSSSPLSANISVERGPSVASLQAHFMAELSDSEDDDVSEVESFILEQGELDEEPGLDTSKFLLTDDSSENGIDVETQCRLEALLEASGNFFENGQIETCSSGPSYAEQVESYKLSVVEAECIGKLALADGKQLADHDVLRRLTSSVSCALDEAAAALNRMRTEPPPPDPPIDWLVQHSYNFTLCNIPLIPKLPNVSSDGCALDETAAALNLMYTEPPPLDSPIDWKSNCEKQERNSSVLATTSQQCEEFVCRSIAEACSDGDICTVRRMLDEGRNVNEVTEDGDSLLSLACSSGYYELAQLLLAMRANVEDRGLKDTTPLMEAASGGHVDMVKLLIQHGADVNAQTCQEKRIKGAKIKNQDLQMKTQQDIHSNLPSIVCPEGNTPLMFACAAGYTEIAQVLIDAGANVEDHNENGHTPLMEAASAGHVEVAKLLVERGASINTHSNEFKESALTLACYKGHLEMVRFLLEAGADQEHKTDEMHTALMEASMDGHVEVARLLLDSGAQVNMPADSFESPLTLAACGGHVELAMLLLERGANIEEVNDEGYTPLMEAAREGHEEMVSLLLSQGADINAQTEETQETALTLACCGGFLEVADFLIKAGADIELGASTPLMEASQEGHLELVRYLINAGANVNATTATGDTALTYACENGHTDVADILLQASAKLEHESEGGRTPLMKAARAGHLCTVQFLISKGSNVNKQTTNNDHNPLSLACAGGHLPIVELLLAHGADPTHKLKDNSTMLIEASKGGHTAVVQLLLDYPNSLLASPPPPPDISQLSTQTLEANEAPRVPPHGLQIFSPQEADQNAMSTHSYLTNVQSVPRIQEILQARDTLPGASVIAIPKQKSLQRKNASVKNSEAPSSSVCENLQRYHYRNKNNVAAQANSVSIQAETGSPKCCSDNDHSGCTGGGGGGIESVEDKDLKPSERLEACINSMMKKAELLHPSPEEQIYQKQQILEELQRVERELQEKAQAQLILSAQNSPHHPNLQGLGAIVTATPTITTVSSNSGSVFPTVSGMQQAQQLLVNSGAILDIESLSSSVAPDLSAHLAGLNLRSPSTVSTQTAQPSVQSMPVQQLYQHTKPVQQPSVTSTSMASDYTKSRLNKQSSKQAVLKQIQQQYYQLQQNQLQSSIKIQSQPMQAPNILEDIDKLNLRNVVLTDQQQQQFQHQQQLIHQHPQQQFVLSEFTQNLTLRANREYSEGAADALAFMQAAGGIKFTTDSTQTHAIPIFDPVTVGQALLQQQLQQQQLQQHQQLSQALQQDTKRQQQQQQQSQQQQQQQQQQHFDKNKISKGKVNKVQQQSLLQVSQPQLHSLQVQQTQQALKQQLSSSCGEACALVGNIPIDATGVLTLSGMAAPAFPVSLAVSPVSLSSPVSMSTSCGATFAHNMSLDDGLMVAAPARTLHETLGEIMTGPTTQLAGNQMNIGPQGTTTHCGELCPGARSRSLSITSLPGVTTSGSLPLSFHTLAQSVTPCVPLQVTTADDGSVTSHHLPHLGHVPPTPSTPAPPLYPPLDLNSQTDSNHDTALTLACAGGHEELVSLLLSRGADIEHRDKKGFTPLMLAATAGHGGVVEILLNHGADIEAQSERTKDTALSLACSGGRYEVVDILLSRGANKEHRNVSDYTPLSLAASGGYVNIIKLLLSHGAEINSRTGSKLGISPLMLAAMNGHTQAVKLLLDMGSDINAQIETNRNTALTLACFQGRHEVVSLLLDRRANVEHRAKTGLTPLMEAASGGYVEVGKVLIDKGADVNAPPVPSSRDTALTIAADKGHYRFVELLLQRDAIVDVKNKKGNSPLWLAANGGHLDVIQLLVANSADIDSQDNRKVSCLMAAFRKGHVKAVKWMVKHVTQYPSEQEMSRYMATVTDKELLRKCRQCEETIRIAKERQAAEANKNANILLEELDQERSREESRKAAAARRRERKRRKKREKQEQMRAAKAAAEENKKSDKSNDQQTLSKQQLLQQSSQSEDEDEEDEEDDDEEEEKEDDRLFHSRNSSINAELNLRLIAADPSPERNKSNSSNTTGVSHFKGKRKDIYVDELDSQPSIPSKCNNETTRSEKRREREREKLKNQEKNKRNAIRKAASSESRLQKEIPVAEKHAVKTESTSSSSSTVSNNCRNNKKRNQKSDVSVVTTSASTTTTTTTTTSSSSSTSNSTKNASIVASTQVHSNPEIKCQSNSHKHHKHQKEIIMNGIGGNADYDEFCALFSAATTMRGKGNKSSDAKLTLETLGELALDLPNDITISTGLKSPSSANLSHNIKSSLSSSSSPKKWQKRDEGWKEVVRRRFENCRSKKVSVPSNAISRVIGRGGCNINAIREGSGAHIEVEKQKGQGDRTIIIRGSAESTRLAQQLIAALIKEPDKDLSEILLRCGLNRTNTSIISSLDSVKTTVGCSVNSSSVSSTQVQVSSSQTKGTVRLPSSTKISGIPTSVISKSTSIPPPSLPANAAPPFSNQLRSIVTNTQNIRPGIPVCTVGTPPFVNPTSSVWTGVVVGGKVASITPRPTAPVSNPATTMNLTTVTTRVVTTTTTMEKSPVVRQLFPVDNKCNTVQQCSSTTTSTKATVSYTMAVIAQGKAPKTVPAGIVTVASKVTTTSDVKVSTIPPSIERAGSAPPGSAVITSHAPGSHNTCSGPSSVQPFSLNQTSKVTNGQSVIQSGVSVSRGQQSSSQNKPFVSSAPTSNQTSPNSNNSSSNNPPLSPTLSNKRHSTVAQDYSPFNNIFSKHAHPCVWGQKENSKPNFASVAASGVTSVACQVQNSNPVQSSLTLSLPQNCDHELIVDAAKAPGYRGNLHISPSASSNSSTSSIHSQHGMSQSANFGPIGPRSAPCTPPLGPIGPPSGTITRRSTPPAAPSPPPLHSRSLPESHSTQLNDLSRSVSGNCSCIVTQHTSSQLSETLFHHQNISMSSQPSRLQSYPLASFAGPSGTNTTFSQHSPLSSVGTIVSEGSNNGNVQVVQSNLNPNAPDFSSRASLLMAQHGPSMHHVAPRLGPNNFQDNSVPPQLAQFRPILTSTGGMNHTFPLHAMPNQHPQTMNRFPVHHAHNQQQQQQQQQQQNEYNQSAPAGPIGSLPPGMGAISQGADALPLLSMMGGYPPHPSQLVPGNGNIPHHYPMMHSIMGIRPNQRSASTTPSVGASSKDEGSPMATMSPNSSPQGSNLPSPTGLNVQDNPNPAGTIGEDRKLPRPIGMERAQRKNPMFGGVSDVGGIWSFSSSGRSDMPAAAATGDWITNMQGAMNAFPSMPQDETGMPQMLHNNYGNNRFAEMLGQETSHPVEHSYQAVAGAVSGGSGCYPFVNGLPPHLLAPHLYQTTNNTPGQMDPQLEMWGVHPKIPLSSGEGLPQTVEHKMAWQNWSSHQA